MRRRDAAEDNRQVVVALKLTSTCIYAALLRGVRVQVTVNNA